MNGTKILIHLTSKNNNKNNKISHFPFDQLTGDGIETGRQRHLC